MSSSTPEGKFKQKICSWLRKKIKNIPADVLLKKMEGFMEKYGDSKFIQEARESFASGKITRRQFNERIKTFKTYNVRYLISGS